MKIKDLPDNYVPEGMQLYLDRLNKEGEYEKYVNFTKMELLQRYVKNFTATADKYDLQTAIIQACSIITALDIYVLKGPQRREITEGFSE
jgi:hypothetical protein